MLVILMRHLRGLYSESSMSLHRTAIAVRSLYSELPSSRLNESRRRSMPYRQFHHRCFLDRPECINSGSGYVTLWYRGPSPR